MGERGMVIVEYFNKKNAYFLLTKLEHIRKIDVYYSSWMYPMDIRPHLLKLVRGKITLEDFLKEFTYRKEYTIERKDVRRIKRVFGKHFDLYNLEKLIILCMPHTKEDIFKKPIPAYADWGMVIKVNKYGKITEAFMYEPMIDVLWYTDYIKGQIWINEKFVDEMGNKIAFIYHKLESIIHEKRLDDILVSLSLEGRVILYIYTSVAYSDRRKAEIPDELVEFVNSLPARLIKVKLLEY